jgi:pimeloyl-ACP methyl ester carboxylesterase
MAAIEIDIDRYFLHTRLPITSATPALSEQRETMRDFELPNTRYALSGDVNIAFQVMGDGPIDIILVPGIVSHVEFLHEFPEYTGFLRRLATFARVVTFDKRGHGLSDGISGRPRSNSVLTTFAPSWTPSNRNVPCSWDFPRALQ